MKYTNEVKINAPLEKVVELFDNPDNIAKWQPGFVSMEHIEGEKGQVGSKYRMKYKMGKREIEMVETILERNLPEVFAGTYEAKGVWNKVINHFKDNGDNTTRYWTENEFKMKGMMKLMAWLMPGAFKKQSQKYLDLFKDFVEQEVKS
jgi:uncharacterized protein YndB with AHSA1/START domain